jgi:AMMECR1 domain-containing protein
LLTAPQPMRFSDEADALRQLRPDVDGVIFSAGNHRSTFLPQVWEQLPDPRQFMAHLKQKAGLPADYWSPDVQLQRYEVRNGKKRRPMSGVPARWWHATRTVASSATSARASASCTKASAQPASCAPCRTAS